MYKLSGTRLLSEYSYKSSGTDKRQVPDKSGDLEFDSQPRPWIFHLLQWVSISVPEDL